MITHFSQRDERWQADILGSGSETIGAAGCLITCMASLLSDFGVPTDPHRLNLWLNSHGGYVKGNLFVFDSVAGLGVDLVDYVDCRLTPAPIDALQDALNAGAAVVVEVDAKPGGPLDRHWVRLVSLSHFSGWIMDPWQLPGGEARSLHDYLAPDWATERGIFAAAVYARNGDGAVFEVMDRGGAHQDRLGIFR